MFNLMLRTTKLWRRWLHGKRLMGEIARLKCWIMIKWGGVRRNCKWNIQHTHTHTHTHCRCDITALCGLKLSLHNKLVVTVCQDWERELETGFASQLRPLSERTWLIKRQATDVYCFAVCAAQKATDVSDKFAVLFFFTLVSYISPGSSGTQVNVTKLHVDVCHKI
jgi:hypothetical protein